MALEFAMTDQIATDSGIKILVYSESGIGKTMLCATAPTPIILSAEAGLLSLKKTNIERINGVNTPGITYNIPIIHIRSIGDLQEAYRWLTESKDAASFQSVCMDSLTEIAETVLTNAKKVATDPRQAYGAMQDQMISLVKSYRDIVGKNVIMLSKMEKEKDEVSGAMLYGPTMPGKKTGPALPYLFDEVFRMGIAKDKDKEFRFLQTQPDLQYTAKDRSGTLAAFEPPNLTHIINKIRGK